MKRTLKKIAYYFILPLHTVAKFNFLVISKLDNSMSTLKKEPLLTDLAIADFKKFLFNKTSNPTKNNVFFRLSDFFFSLAFRISLFHYRFLDNLKEKLYEKK